MKVELNKKSSNKYKNGEHFFNSLFYKISSLFMSISFSVTNLFGLEHFITFLFNYKFVLIELLIYLLYKIMSSFFESKENLERDICLKNKVLI